MGTTNDRNDPRLQQIGPDGQQAAYLVLSEEERAKGFVRPVLQTYRHVGRPGPKHPLRDLDDVEAKRYAGTEYVKFEAYPDAPVYPGESRTTGRYWTQRELDGGCQTNTTMGLEIAETYARDPGFYGGTYCARCLAHYPVGPDGEFVWVDQRGRVTNERVGT